MSDFLSISGAAYLNGTLNVSLIDGYTPMSGDRFSFLGSMGSCSGTFAATNFPTEENGEFVLQYNAFGMTFDILFQGNGGGGGLPGGGGGMPGGGGGGMP